MENQTGRWRRIQRLHLRLLNLLARVFGLSAVVAATGFIAWAVYYFLHPDAATYDMVTLSGHASVDFLGAGIFCLLLAILFLTVRPYRPDITRAGGADVKRRLTWWTGEPR
jgi:H+/Cl- antiporter ClcA